VSERTTDEQFRALVTDPPVTLDEAKKWWAWFSPELRLAMAKTAPKVAGKWSRSPTGATIRPDATPHRSGGMLGIVTKAVTAAGWFAQVLTVHLGLFPSEAEAQSACDAELIRQGYVLENEP
jgi:hypothetical protein